MGNRLSKIYTRTGDDGTTGLAGGARVAKHSLRVAAMGDLDEFNSCIGLLRSSLSKDDTLQPILSDVQHNLFNLGAVLATPNADTSAVAQKDVDALESILDELNATLPPLKEFILPGGSESVARCHLARAVCRRCERAICALQAEEALLPIVATYVNRLSDLLFVVARSIGARDNEQEVLWQR